MAFYHKPPKGILSFAKLDHGAKTRIQFLLGIHSCNGNMVLMKDLVEQTCTVEDSEWFIEGGKKDCVSHYFCRLACSQIPEMAQFFVHAETTLFRYRVTCMREEELIQTVKQIGKFYKLMMKERNLNKYLQQTLDTITALTKSHELPDIVKEYMKGSNIILRVPFVSVINLVKHRKVPLCKGMALVPVTSLLEILVTIFKDVLQYGLKLAVERYHEAKEDPRIRRLFLQLKAIFLGRFPSLTSVSSRYHLRCDDIDNASRAFPLCMSLLHQTLRKKHRLSHSARIQYTLFLKECGLPVNEAILFWQREYSQPALNSTCTHRWDKDGRRYIYNIRHLYGLEGSRINYRGHNCSAIQDFHISSSQEGGCPFKHMDIENLTVQLSKEDLSICCQREVVEKASTGEYSTACELYLCGSTSAVLDIEDTGASQRLKCGAKRIKTENDCQEIEVEQKQNSLNIETKDTSVRLHGNDLKICDIKMEHKSVKVERMDVTVQADSSHQYMFSRNCNQAKCKQDKTEGNRSIDFEESVCSSILVKTEAASRGKDNEMHKMNACDLGLKDKAASRKRSRPYRDQCCDSESKHSMVQRSQKVMHAPVDYYESYCQMVDGLR